MDLAQAPKFGFLFVRKPANSLFFNQKIDPLPAARERQPGQAFGHFGGRVEIVIDRYFDGGEFA